MSETLSDLLLFALPGLTVQTAAPRGAMWLSNGAGTPAFCLLAAGGKPCLWHPDRIADIAADLDAAQPLLDRIEHVSGWRFEPRAVSAAAAEQALTIGDGETLVELVIDADQDIPAALVAAAASAPRDPARPVPRAVTILIPDIPVEQASALEAGDMLIMPPVVNATIEGFDTANISLDMAAGCLAVSRWDTGGPRFAVPVEVRLPRMLLSDSELQTLAHGEAVAIGPPIVGAEVELFVGGRDIARGTVVHLGQARAIRLHSLQERET